MVPKSLGNKKHLTISMRRIMKIWGHSGQYLGSSWTSLPHTTCVYHFHWPHYFIVLGREWSLCYVGLGSAYTWFFLVTGKPSYFIFYLFSLPQLCSLCVFMYVCNVCIVLCAWQLKITFNKRRKIQEFSTTVLTILWLSRGLLAKWYPYFSWFLEINF